MGKCCMKASVWVTVAGDSLPVKEAAVHAMLPAVSVQGQNLTSVRCALKRLSCMQVLAVKPVPGDIMPGDWYIIL